MHLREEITRLIGETYLSEFLSEVREVVQEEAGKQEDADMREALEQVADDLDVASTDAETGGL